MDWQQLAALALVAAAALWLIRTQILAPRGGGCGGCGSCPSAARPASRPAGQSMPQLVQIDLDLGAPKSKANAHAPNR